jgi:hypothetical protein
MSEFARSMAAEVQSRPPVARATETNAIETENSIGNLATARHLRGGGIAASFPGAPAGNQDEQRARSTSPPFVVQRACCADCECDDEPVMRSGVDGSGITGEHRVRSLVDRATSGGGRPLDDATRASIEPRLERSLADVRVHDDAAAGESARALHARAFTVGNDVVFGHGQLRPDLDDGRKLLAHELAHVAQQGKGLATKSLVSDRSDPAEREAEAFAEGTVESVREAPHAHVHRQDEPADDEPPAEDDVGSVTMEGYVISPTAESITQAFDHAAKQRGEEGVKKIWNGLEYVRDMGAIGGYQMDNEMAGVRVGDVDQAVLANILEVGQPIYDQFITDFEAIRSTFLSAAEANARKILDDNENQAKAEALRYGIKESDIEMWLSGEATADESPTETGNVYGTDNYDPYLEEDEPAAEEPAPSDEPTFDDNYDPYDPQEWTQYSMDEQSFEANKMAAAANVLLKRREEIVDLMSKADLLPANACPTTPDEMLLQTKVNEYHNARAALIAEFPILAGFSKYKDVTVEPLVFGEPYGRTWEFEDEDTEKLRTIADNVPGPEMAAVLGAEIREKFDNIAKVRAGLGNKGEINLWRMENLVSVTLAQLGWESDPLYKRIITETVGKENEPGLLEPIGLLVFNLGAIALSGVTGGLSLVAAAGVNIYFAGVHIDEYLMAKAISGTAFDKAQALSAHEPSLFWLAVEIAGTFLDVAEAVQVMKALGPLVKAAQAAKSGDEAALTLEAVQKAAGSMKDGEKLAAKLKASIIAAREGGGFKAVGVFTPDELDELAKVTKTARETELATELGTAEVKSISGSNFHITEAGDIWVCSDPCTIFLAKYRNILVEDSESLSALQKIQREAQDNAEAVRNARAVNDDAKLAELSKAADDIKRRASQFEKSLFDKHPMLHPVEGGNKAILAAKEVAEEASIDTSKRVASIDVMPEKPPNMTKGQEERWTQYVEYFEQRRQAILDAPGQKPQFPLKWTEYDTFKGRFQRGHEFQGEVQNWLQSESDTIALGGSSEATAVFGKMKDPVLEGAISEAGEIGGGVGIAGKEAVKPTTKFADQIIYDAADVTSAKPTVVAVSNKSRIFTGGSEAELTAYSSQALADAEEAISKYGGTINIRRESSPLFNKPVEVERVVLVYDARYVSFDAQDAIEKALAGYQYMGQPITVVFHFP